MCPTTLSLQPATMGTKPLTQAAYYEIRRSVHEKNETEVCPLHMDWVVVTETNGNRRLQMRWRAN